MELEAVIGVEAHVALLCTSKMFCACPTGFDTEPNMHVCPVCAGLPGALPVLNRHAVALCVRAGLLFGCTIAHEARMDRKNYFYPDLPKGYQISQQDMPVCRDGKLTADGRSIAIARIHIEEDAGKLLHRDGDTLVDLNRCGVPLIEVVSAPDIRTPEETRAYMKTLHDTLVAYGVTDGKMNEGSMRFDLNVSMRAAGTRETFARTEVKNVNSFRFARAAVAYEISRQTEIILSGGVPESQTRRYDEKRRETCLMRGKESYADYRYFREPDIPAFYIHDEDIAEEAAEIDRIRTEIAR